MVCILTPTDLIKIITDNWQRLHKLESVTVQSTKGINLEDIKKHLPNLTFIENR
jgi:hypothetical protein